MRYEDIINLERPVSKRHAKMPVRDRAAQFAPFAALAGYNAAISETARQTSEKIELDEYEKAEINRRLNFLLCRIDEKPTVKVTYFLSDAKKQGGSYVDIEERAKGVNVTEGILCLQSGGKIPIEDIVKIGIEDNKSNY